MDESIPQPNRLDRSLIADHRSGVANITGIRQRNERMETK